MKLTNKKNGFTIVELVIVIAVIAILAAVLIPTFSGVVAKANQSAAQQTAMNAVKAGLMMTSTATLPDGTFILIDSDKVASSKPDYGYKYTGNSLGDAVALYDESTKAFKDSLLGQASVILINNEAIKEYTLNKDAATAAEAISLKSDTGKFEALLLSMLSTATGKDLTNAAVKYNVVTSDGGEKSANNEWVLSSIEVEYQAADSTTNPATPRKAFTVYTSPDMPANVIVFVTMD